MGLTDRASVENRCATRSATVAQAPQISGSEGSATSGGLLRNPDHPCCSAASLRLRRLPEAQPQRNSATQHGAPLRVGPPAQKLAPFVVLQLLLLWLAAFAGRLFDADNDYGWEAVARARLGGQSGNDATSSAIASLEPARRLLAVDPGSERSAWVMVDPDGRLVAHGTSSNEQLLERFRRTLASDSFNAGVADLVIEWMAPRGMPTSAQEFETMWWVGRFTEAARPLTVHRLTRHRVKIALCGKGSANDVNIRAALIDRYGGTGGKAAAVGTVKAPGPLHGIANDEWSALAVAVAWQDGAR